jgi:hypothetical protein
MSVHLVVSASSPKAQPFRIRFLVHTTSTKESNVPHPYTYTQEQQQKQPEETTGLSLLHATAPFFFVCVLRLAGAALRRCSQPIRHCQAPSTPVPLCCSVGEWSSHKKRMKYRRHPHSRANTHMAPPTKEMPRLSAQTAAATGSPPPLRSRADTARAPRAAHSAAPSAFLC